MAHRTGAPSTVRLDEALLSLAITEHERAARPRLDTLWTYFRNPLRPVGPGAALPAAGAASPCPRPGRWYRLAQEMGLPPRIVGHTWNAASLPYDDRTPRREIVVENDIAWRIQAMVDFMFGKPVQILSTARDEATRRAVERALDAVWEASGGIALLQDIALLGHVFGHVDLVVRADESQTPSGHAGDAAIDALRDGSFLRVEAVEPRRGIPILSETDYRRLDAYIMHFTQSLNQPQPPSPLDRLLSAPRRWLGDAESAAAPSTRRAAQVTEVITPHGSRLTIDGSVIDERPFTLFAGALPVVHIQNMAQPFAYEGLSEVEPLIPLQDELNTRLSDRASRVTMQSFKMYLAKGLEGFEKAPVGPGAIWSTDNPDASVQAFGGDAASPSEDQHILEIREALDKISGVPPLASGVVRAKIGNLTSANALRITMMGVLSRTARKRVTYGRAIAQASRLILTALDASGVLPTDESDRAVRLEWPDPLPVDVREQVAAAKAKADLGVPSDRILAELGYAPTDPGVA